jgi:hypothetical protein
MCRFWEILEETFDLEVGGNLNIGTGVVDLVVKDPAGQYSGIQVKNFSETQRKSGKEIAFVNQILKYMLCGYFDYFYVSILAKQVQVAKSILDFQRYFSPLYRVNYPDEYEKFSERGSYLSSCGILAYPPRRTQESDVSLLDLVEKESTRLPRSKEPLIPRTNKARLRFDVWNYYKKTKKFLPLCEGVLPNPRGKRLRQIDVMAFDGSDSVNEILRNQERFDLIGIHVENDLSNPKTALDSLNLFLNSGGLTRLYLAVIPDLEEDALSFIKDIPYVGLIIAEKGNTKIIREAEKLQIRFDSVLYEQAGFQDSLGFHTEISRKIIEIGSGIVTEKHDSTYVYQE